MSPADDDSARAQIFGFTREEWVQARAFELPDAEAERSVAEMFAQHQALGSEGFVFNHRDMLRLAYVSTESRSRVLAQLRALGAFGAELLDKLQHMDRETRAGGRLRRPPATEPL